MDKFSIHRVPLHPSIRTTQPNNKPIQTQKTFLAHLEEATKQELKVSKHAHERIIQRNITISEQEWQAVSDKVFEAHSKGVKQPLVLMDQAALIVSAKNATVITAMDRTEAKQQLFTNIDGTIVL
ncbi:TIGR02530 family flagellar biosynthesis protein [Lysinibacillus sp. FSL H8-0500]|uniref:Flagellar protein n=1 Tax=Lysinibacillus macroides TaxID=33935 RepID=A0A0M9DKV8_9BACI|nr:TIGR02530 family flagellar biosynthesis protein [Lysinibacillus macroides]KOY82683.1 flagellar protein [Lysinibacillus macroides]QPR66273.1 flagellar protein [Lysinibacillus macroides]